jgi:hypothetical protein
MSAGVSFSDEVLWISNQLVEALLGALANQAEACLGPAHPMSCSFRESFEGYYSGFIVFFDEWAGDKETKEHLLSIMSAAADDLCRQKVLTEYGEQWLKTEFQEMIRKICLG